MTAYRRRKVLIDRMTDLESKGKGCTGCRGTCCTFEANSMMVSPLEAMDLMNYLKAKNELSEDLKSKCQEAVQKYRLDSMTGNGRRSFIRRTYTCPFFNHKELGCPLPREVKPYGCLAFNSHHEEKKASEHCFSETDLLLMRESADENENSLNESVKKKFKLYWEKLPLPLALLEIWDTDIDFND